MLAYYVHLSCRSLVAAKKTALLIVLIMSFGIASSLTAWALVHALGNNPLPDHGALRYVRLNAVPKTYVATGLNPANDTTYPDAMALMRRIKDIPQAAVASMSTVIYRPNDEAAGYRRVPGHMVTARFFDMFKVPIEQGHAWSPAEDRARLRQVLLSSALAAKLFGSPKASMGRRVMLGAVAFTVAGVYSNWSIIPNVYSDVGTSAFGEADQFFIPLSIALDAGIKQSSNLACWKYVPSDKQLTSNRCSWLQLWAKVNSRSQEARYKAMLLHYTKSAASPGTSIMTLRCGFSPCPPGWITAAPCREVSWPKPGLR